jgi:hypothetical protein
VVSGARNYYYPYGGNRGGAAFNGLTTKRYTGQISDASGLIFMNEGYNRYAYANNLRRWPPVRTTKVIG